MSKTPVLRIRKDYRTMRDPIYVPEYYRVGLFSSGWRDFMINDSHIAKPISHFKAEVKNSLRDIEVAKRHLALYREVYLDDKIVYEVFEKGDTDGL